MIRIRFVLLLAPLLTLLIGWLAVRSFLGGLESGEVVTEGDGLVVAYQGNPAQLDLLGMPDRVSRAVSELVLEPLLRVDDEGNLEPVLAEAWSMPQTTRFYLQDEIVAQEAAIILDDAPEDKRERWGLIEVGVEGGELRVELERPTAVLQEEMIVFFGAEKLALLPRIRVEVEGNSARDYHTHYLQNAVGGEQIRDVRFEGDSVYELLVSGELEPFLDELKIYYGSEGGDLLKALDTLEPLRWVDETRVVFALDEDRDWHDGEPFDAEDVLFTFESLRSLPEGDGRGQPFRTIKEARALGDFGVEFVYEDFYSPALVSWAGVRMLPEHFLREPDSSRWPQNASSRIPGTGNYRVLGPGEGGELVMGAWGGGSEGGYEKVRFLPLTDPLRRRAALQLGVIDLYLPERPELGALSENSELQVSSSPSGNWTLVAWNVERAPMNDAVVRRALAKGIDVDGLIRDSLAGLGKRIDRIVPDSVGEVPKMKLPAFNPENAAEELANAGWKLNAAGVREKDGKSLAFRLLTNDEDLVRVGIAKRLAEAWKEIGVQVEVVMMPWAEVVSGQVLTREFDAVLLGMENNEGWDLRDLWGSGWNVSGYSNPEVDRLLGQMCKVYGMDDLRKLATQMQKIVSEDQPCLFLFEREIPTVYLPRSGMLKVRAGRHGWPWWRTLQIRGVVEGGKGS